MPTDVIERQIDSLDAGRGRLLAAVEDGKGSVECLFAAGFPENAITIVPGFEVDELKQVSRSVYVRGRPQPVPEGAPAPGSVILPIAGPSRTAPLTPTERELFAGLRSALVLRVHEDVTTIRDWLLFHNRFHGLEALLVVDRALDGPGVLAENLRKLDLPGIKRIVVVTLDVPLGTPGEGDARLPYFAPDAPGRGNMEKPEPDLDYSGLGEHLIHDLMRLLFLQEAAGVLHVDFSDLVGPGRKTIFAAAENEWGLVRLLGERIYPWSVEDASQIRFADHICKRYDGTPDIRRWCIIPGRLPATVSWRARRVRGVDIPDTQPFRRYLRCVAVRHPTDKINRLVPKASLIEEPDLLTLFGAIFDHQPKRPPALDEVEIPETPAYRTGIVTCMKNEGPFILEWLAFHRVVGVDHFLVYTNDCTDGTDAFLSLLDQKGYLTHRENPFRLPEFATVNTKPQHAALAAASDDPDIQALDWVVCMDVDEFINIHIGDGTLKALYDRVPDANMISMTWRMFGNAGIREYRDEFITDQFTRCAPEFVRTPHQAWGFKSLVRNLGLFKKLGVHRPNGLHAQRIHQLNWVNGSGKRMPQTQYRTAWRSTMHTYGYDLVSLNHYAVRSAESFLVKRDRGRVNHVAQDQGMKYWFRMNHNPVEDTRIRAILPRVRAEYERLLADPDIAAMHAECVAAHRAKIAELMAQPEYRAFYDEITSEKLSILSHHLKKFGRSVFHEGPSCLPPDILTKIEDEDYFLSVKHDMTVDAD